jgi:non-canonical purine NTP pyrophosphatase (RdgB/HAM1 family)
MREFVFVTGNMHKVEWLHKFLGKKIRHHELDIVEIQSPLPEVVLEHKAREAYKVIQKPVVVDDVSLVFDEWGSLPGTFVKFFVEGPGLEKTCRMLDGFSDRSCTMRVSYGFFDGKEFQMTSAIQRGEIAQEPFINTIGHGFDAIVIPKGHQSAFGAMSENTYKTIHPRGQAVQQLKLLLK